MRAEGWVSFCPAGAKGLCGHCRLTGPVLGWGECSGGLMHDLEQSSPPWPSSLSPKLRLPALLSPLAPQSCSHARGSLGLLCSRGDCGILVLVCLLRDFRGGGAGIGCFLSSSHPLSLLSFCPALSAVPSCAQPSLCCCPPTARATKHLPTPAPCYAES